MTIEIIDWDKRYEHSDTKKCPTMHWLKLPVKLNGIGYIELVTGHVDGPAHFGCWCALLELAASQHGKFSGALKSFGSAEIAVMTRFPQNIVSDALGRFEKLGWIKGFLNDSGKIQEKFLQDSGSIQEKFPTRVDKSREDKSRKDILSDVCDTDLCDYLTEKLKSIKPDIKLQTKQWPEIFRLMREIDKRDPEKIRRVIDWVVTDEFWSRNILSAKSLRKHFDALEIKMKKSPRRIDVSNPADWGAEDTPDDRM